MIPGLLGALGAAVLYGTATVLQAVGVRRASAAAAAAAAAGTRAPLLAKAWAGRLYAAGLACDAVGFLASLGALRSLPLFVVQSAIAASVAVTALLAVMLLGARLSRWEVGALLLVGLGLVALAASAAEGSARHLSPSGAWALLGGVAAVAGLMAGAGKASSGRSCALFAAAAGLGFGGVGIAARVLVLPHPWARLLLDPVAWALAAYAVLALVAYAYALERGSVTTTAAVAFGVETVVPSAIGLAVLGDRVRPGLAPLAALGFLATLAGAMALAGRAEGEPAPAHLGAGRTGEDR